MKFSIKTLLYPKILSYFRIAKLAKLAELAKLAIRAFIRSQSIPLMQQKLESGLDGSYCVVMYSIVLL